MSIDNVAPLPGRQQDILRRALSEKVVRIKDLAAEFGVHEMTVRRDLDALCEQGKLLRVHGGAQLLDKTSEELSQSMRAAQNVDAKERIARAALLLIQDGDTVALDASTTSLALARLLPARKVQVIACSLDAANVLSAAGVPFLMVGGNFHAPARSFVGAFFTDTISRLHPDLVFFSAKAYTFETGFTDPHLPEVGAKRALIASGSSVVALLDSSKVGRRALATIAGHADINTLITDADLPAELLSQLDEADIQVIVAP
ncbi:DeoR/GlpR family DNA-binding transcription regulator [Deinococcus rubellus]|uniref:DeoR/GlpR family DNA-binding transcription regulator n=1 Tax=Deinococcus rubellus TaxID=1889240 RepID=A0ABY5YKF6_9DEIO|nr:DeoR/GlpR family DNA-binding transcription regulator [Deinococcus rubellus]UWX65191.1 DeoR/GlpR family DNA-binding transcription regulator [Deinococcus rubellus]